MGHIFISYSHKDAGYVHKLAKTLEKEGFKVWIDDRIDYGTKWPHEIQKHLDASDAFIVVITPRSYKSDWVQNELSRAKRKAKPIFPLLLEGEPWLSVEATQCVDVTHGKLPSEKFYQHLAAVTSRRKRRASQSVSTLPVQSAPKQAKPQDPPAIRNLHTIDERRNLHLTYLRQLYMLSNGDLLAYFPFSKIGKDLGWEDKLSDEISDDLKSQGYVDFPSFGTVCLTHSGIKYVENLEDNPLTARELTTPSPKSPPASGTPESTPKGSPRPVHNKRRINFFIFASVLGGLVLIIIGFIAFRPLIFLGHSSTPFATITMTETFTPKPTTSPTIIRTLRPSPTLSETITPTFTLTETSTPTATATLAPFVSLYVTVAEGSLTGYPPLYIKLDASRASYYVYGNRYACIDYAGTHCTFNWEVRLSQDNQASWEIIGGYGGSDFYDTFTTPGVYVVALIVCAQTYPFPCGSTGTTITVLTP